MAPKHHPTPLSGGDRKALAKELGRARAMTTLLATQSEEARAKGTALIRQADRLLRESWNERMWADGEPIDLRHPWIGSAHERHRKRHESNVGVLIGAEYLEANEPAVKEQLQKAAVRLARVLDVAFRN